MLCAQDHEVRIWARDPALADAINRERRNPSYLSEVEIPDRVRATADLESAVAGAELVCMAGFLQLLHVPPDFTHRVMNIHPALLPAFGGKGYHGLHVHQAALDVGVKVSGCTVHFADDTYDTGPILVQKCVPVKEGDDPDTLAARVFQAECEAYPEAIRLIAEGRATVQGRRVIISG